jgi:hypothetical protein
MGLRLREIIFDFYSSWRLCGLARDPFFLGFKLGVFAAWRETFSF